MVKTDLFESYFIPARKRSPYLMIVLHGKGDSLQPFRNFNSELALPMMNYLLLNAPKRYLDGYSWYGEPPYQHNGVLRVRSRLFTLLSDLEQQGWKPAQIFLLGFSQGCLVSADIALHYSKPLCGVIGVAGYFHFYPKWRQSISPRFNQVPWLMLHGRQDDILPIEQTLFGVQKLRRLGLDIDWVESDKEHVFEDDDYPVIRRWIKQRLQISS